MRYIPRLLTPVLRELARSFPSVILTGPRRAGKTTLLRRMLPGASYVLLEDPDIQNRVSFDPRGFLDGLKTPVILDEVQSTPALFNYVRSRIDAAPEKKGRYFFTGSQEAPLMRNVTESMAGRAGVVSLLPLSAAESPKVSLLSGGFPEAVASPRVRSQWFASYLQTYLERDVRAITQVRELRAFRRFLTLVATTHGRTLNRSALAAPLGLSVPTIDHWISILETTGQVLPVYPYFENFGKRIIKSPKLYFYDSGLVCHLLGIHSESDLRRSPFYGFIYEGFIASEIVKSQINAGGRSELYFFRDREGLEVDFVLPRGNGVLWFIEVKASRTPVPQMAAPLTKIAPGGELTRVQRYLVHQFSKSQPRTRAMLPGVSAVTDVEFLRMLNPKT